MGIHDRDYYRGDEPKGFFLGGDRSMVANLIIINAVLYVADALFFDRGALMLRMGLGSDLFQHPLDFWQLLTYGFAHDPNRPWHILLNMYGLWVFGREVEGIYGRKTFLQLYLSLIVLSGLTWLATTFRYDQPVPLVGASGAVVGIMFVFLLHFPARTILFMMFVPMPAWVFGVLYLLLEFNGVKNGNDVVAHAAHLGGAGFGFVFYRLHWTLFSIVPERLLKRGFKARPKLRLHSPEEDDRLLGERVDQILEKISREGEASLTKEERRTLEDASRRYQRRRS